MLQRKNLLIVAILAVGVVACCAFGGCTSTAQMRIENVSELDFEDVTVQGVPYGDIAAGETSDYYPVELTCRYALMKLSARGRRLNAQSLNFGARRFTHRVDVLDLEKGHLGVEIVHD